MWIQINPYELWKINSALNLSFPIKEKAILIIKLHSKDTIYIHEYQLNLLYTIIDLAKKEFCGLNGTCILHS